jgi:hypothetical protein
VKVSELRSWFHCRRRWGVTGYSWPFQVVCLSHMFWIAHWQGRPPYHIWLLFGPESLDWRMMPNIIRHCHICASSSSLDRRHQPSPFFSFAHHPPQAESQSHFKSLASYTTSAHAYFNLNMASLLERMNMAPNSVGPVRSKSQSSRGAAAPYVRGLILRLRRSIV